MLLVFSEKKMLVFFFASTVFQERHCAPDCMCRYGTQGRLSTVNLHAALVGQLPGNAVLAECLYPCPVVTLNNPQSPTHNGCLYIFRHNYIAETRSLL